MQWIIYTYTLVYLSLSLCVCVYTLTSTEPFSNILQQYPATILWDEPRVFQHILTVSDGLCRWYEPGYIGNVHMINHSAVVIPIEMTIKETDVLPSSMEERLRLFVLVLVRSLPTPISNPFMCSLNGQSRGNGWWRCHHLPTGLVLSLSGCVSLCASPLNSSSISPLAQTALLLHVRVIRMVLCGS